MGSQHSKQLLATQQQPPEAPAVDAEKDPTGSSSASGTTTAPQLQFLPCDDDWAYVWAIRDFTVLDWRKACPTPDMLQTRMLEQLQLPVDITSNVYLGNADCISNVARLTALGITAVLNVAGQTHKRATLQALHEAGIAYRHIPTVDAVDYPLLAVHWQEIYQALQSMTTSSSNHHKNNNRAVVHCHAGQNRAGLVVAAYTMVTERLTVLETVRLLRRQRGNTALVNHGFQEQLVALARALDALGPAPGTPGSIVRQRPTSPRSEPWIVQRPVVDNDGKEKRRIKWGPLGQVVGASRRWNN